MGEISQAVIPLAPLELSEPQAPITERFTEATRRVASFLLAAGALAGAAMLSGCSSSENEAAPPPPPPAYSAPPVEGWGMAPTPSVQPTAAASPSPSPSRAPEVGGQAGGVSSPFNCEYASAEKKNGKLEITVGGKGNVTAETHSGVMEDDGIRWYPGTRFQYKPDGGAIIVVAGTRPAGSVPSTGAKILFGTPGSDIFDPCGTISRY